MKLQLKALFLEFRHNKHSVFLIWKKLAKTFALKTADT